MIKACVYGVVLLAITGQAIAAINTNPNNYFCNVVMKARMDANLLPWIYHPTKKINAATLVGTAVGVYQNGQVCHYGYGTTQIGNNTPPDKNTIFEIGSITKTFTATVLAIKALAGQLDSNLPKGAPQLNALVNIQAYNIYAQPGVPKRVILPGIYNQTTYGTLASFFAGFPDAPPGVNYLRYPSSLQAYNQRDFVLKFLNQNLINYQSTIGQYVYSNAAYGFLGELLMTLDYPAATLDWSTPTQFDQWMAKYIYQPLQMTCTSVVVPTHCNKETQGYLIISAQKIIASKPPWPWDPLGPAGNIRSNSANMIYYIQALLGEKHIVDENGQRVASVPPSLTNAMQFTQTQPQPFPIIDSYAKSALSWQVLSNPHFPQAPFKHPWFFKNGATQGFTSVLMLNPKNNIGVIFLFNSYNSLDASLGFRNLSLFATDIINQTPSLYTTTIRFSTTTSTPLLITAKNTPLWQIQPGKQQKIALPATTNTERHILTLTSHGQQCDIQVTEQGKWETLPGCSSFFMLTFPSKKNNGTLQINLTLINR